MFNFRREIFADLRRGGNAERCQGYLHKYPTSGSRLRSLRTDHQPVASPHGFSVWRSETTYTIQYIYNQHTCIYILCYHMFYESILLNRMFW